MGTVTNVSASDTLLLKFGTETGGLAASLSASDTLLLKLGTESSLPPAGSISGADTLLLKLGTETGSLAASLSASDTLLPTSETELTLPTARSDIARAAEILDACDRIRFLTPPLHQEMRAEVRWPGDPAPDTGIDARSLKLDPADAAVLENLRSPDVTAITATWHGRPGPG